MKVFVRIRPLLPAELEEGARNIIYASSTDREVIIEDGSEKSFKYDGVLKEDMGQEEVYKQAVALLVKRVKEGFNATILAYGQTGSGKTFTMGTNPSVNQEKEGILQRALQDFLSVDENGPPHHDRTSCQLKISMVEIYSETVYDLLASKKELKIKNEIGGGASIVGLVEESVDTLEKSLALLEKGTLLRSVGTTAMNNGSSRSHALTFLKIKHGNREACLKLVDLAGAEGVGRAQTSGLQFTEGVNINKGLLSLGKVLAALSNSSAYVPYRESLLTRVLKDSLSRGGYTTMIACVNPSSDNVHETINTLRYAEQTRNIKTRVQAMSTIKKRENKRRLEDVSACGEAWKKRIMSTEKAEHNSTISTPGHKPSVRKLAPFFNMTVTTPYEDLADGLSEPASGLLPIAEQRHPPNIGKTLFPGFPPLRTFPSLAKLDSDDGSPSGLSTVSAIEGRSISPFGNSPLMEHLTSHLEKTMMTQLENIEDRVADSIIAKLTKKKGRPKRKEKKMRGKSMCSTPTGIDTSSGTDGESSRGNILEETFAHAFGKNKIQNVVQEALTNALGHFMNIPAQASNKGVAAVNETKLSSEFITDSKKTLTDMTNLSHLQETYYTNEKQVFETPFVKFSQENMKKNLPVTSTALCNTRMVRRSTRLSTQRSRCSPLINRFSPKISHDSEDSIMTDVSVLEANVTAIEANVESSRLDVFSKGINVTTIGANIDSSRLDLFSKGINEKVETSGVTVLHHYNTVIQNDQDTKTEKTHRRKSTRLEAIKASQKNYMIFQQQSPLSNTPKKRSYKKGNASFHSFSRSADSSVLNASLSNQSCIKMASPRLQKEHKDSILTILNTGSLKKLQQLPTIGPKTAMVLYNFRKLYGNFDRIEELETVPGLTKNFYHRFLAANLLTGPLQRP